MRRLALVVLLVAASCGDGNSPPKPAPDAAAVDAAALCARLCALRDQVGCARPLPGCVDACAAGLAGPCGAPWAVAYTCSADRPVTDYICDARGQPQLRNAACADTFTAVQQCVATNR